MTALTARHAATRQLPTTRARQERLRRSTSTPAKINHARGMDFCAQSLRHIVIAAAASATARDRTRRSTSASRSEVMPFSPSPRPAGTCGGACPASSSPGRAPARRHRARPRGRRPEGPRDVRRPHTHADADARRPSPSSSTPALRETSPSARAPYGDRVAALGDYLVTESGFGADIGFEKFWNIKCRVSGMKPDAAVVVATVRALKSHGGGPAVKPGAKLDEAYTRENVGLVEAGCENLRAHIETVRKAGVTPVVCLNASTRTRRRQRRAPLAEETGALRRLQPLAQGGEGAANWPRPVVAAARQPTFHPLYSLDEPVESAHRQDRGERVRPDGREAYFRSRRRNSPDVSDPESAALPHLHGEGPVFALARSDLKAGRRGSFRCATCSSTGAGFIVPVTGDITLCPARPPTGYRRIASTPPREGPRLY